VSRSTVTPLDRHAAHRLRQRYGLDLTDAMKGEIFAHIEAARRAGGRSPLACIIEAQPNHRERWIVSVGGTVVQVVVPAAVLITFLPLNAGPLPANQP